MQDYGPTLEFPIPLVDGTDTEFQHSLTTSSPLTTTRLVTSGDEGTAIVDCDMSAVWSMIIKLARGTSKQQLTWDLLQKVVKQNVTLMDGTDEGFQHSLTSDFL